MQKHIIVHYVGGDKDGARFDSRIPVDRNEVEAVLLLTQEGTQGKSLRTKTEAYKKRRRAQDIEELKRSNYDYHVYKITNREEGDSAISLTLSFCGDEPQYPRLPTARSLPPSPPTMERHEDCQPRHVADRETEHRAILDFVL